VLPVLFLLQAAAMPHLALIHSKVQQWWQRCCRRRERTIAEAAHGIGNGNGNGNGSGSGGGKSGQSDSIGRPNGVSRQRVAVAAVADVD